MQKHEKYIFISNNYNMLYRIESTTMLARMRCVILENVYDVIQLDSPVEKKKRKKCRFNMAR